MIFRLINLCPFFLEQLVEVVEAEDEALPGIRDLLIKEIYMFYVLINLSEIDQKING